MSSAFDYAKTALNATVYSLFSKLVNVYQGIDPWTSLNPVEIIGLAVGFRDKRRMVNALVKEVNAAAYFGEKVRQFLDTHSHEICNPDDIYSAYIDLRNHIQENYLNDSGFYKQMVAADKRSIQFVRSLVEEANKSSTETFVKKLKRVPKRLLREFNDYWVQNNPEYYRLELTALLGRLLSLVDESLLNMVTSKSCRDKEKVLVAPLEPVNISDVGGTGTPVASGGRRRSFKRSNH